MDNWFNGCNTLGDLCWELIERVDEQVDGIADECAYPDNLDGLIDPDTIAPMIKRLSEYIIQAKKQFNKIEPGAIVEPQEKGVGC